jgi:hypothetical protein
MALPPLTWARCAAGGAASCKAGGTVVIASTAAGEPSSLASPNEAYALVLTRTGLLAIQERATGNQQILVNVVSGCVLPAKLVLLPSGQLVLQDKRGTTLWSSTSACRGNSSCYTYDMRNDGQLVVNDGDGRTVWSSNSSTPGSNSQSLGWLEQLTSGGSTKLGCVFSGPVPAAVQLMSPSKAFALRVLQANASLRIVSSSTGAVMWSPAGALAGQAPAQLCISRLGSLLLQGDGLKQLWSTAAPAPGTMAPYSLALTDDGCLDVLDSRCTLLWSSHDAQKKKSGSKAAAFVPVPVRAPSPSPVLVASKTRPPKCTLPQGTLCGGVDMCGKDAACTHLSCCQAPLACRRHNMYSWICAA